MEETKQTPNEPAQPVTPEQAAEIAGGADCTTLGPVTVPGGTLTEAYDGAVDAASHIIERVVNAL